MSKGQTPKIRGTIRNIQAQEIEMNCIILLRRPKGNEIVIMKLKTKIECKSYVLFEAVRP